MSSYRPKPWLNQPLESLPFARLKSLALLEYNKFNPQNANYFSPSLE